MSLQLETLPRCPLCANDLHPEVVHVMFDTGVCRVCAEHLPTKLLHDVAQLLGENASLGDVSVTRGVRFWTPRVYTPRDRPYHLCLERALNAQSTWTEAPMAGNLPFEYLEGSDD